MLGHKSSVRPMKKAAYEAGAKEAIATELCQGMTKRWAVGWTFRDDLNLRQNVKPTKQVRTDTGDGQWMADRCSWTAVRGCKHPTVSINIQRQ